MFYLCVRIVTVKGSYNALFCVYIGICMTIYKILPVAKCAA